MASFNEDSWHKNTAGWNQVKNKSKIQPKEQKLKGTQIKKQARITGEKWSQGPQKRKRERLWLHLNSHFSFWKFLSVVAQKRLNVIYKKSWSSPLNTNQRLSNAFFVGFFSIRSTGPTLVYMIHVNKWSVWPITNAHYHVNWLRVFHLVPKLADMLIQFSVCSQDSMQCCEKLSTTSLLP